MPYLPGSSLKGAIRTAWLNQLDKGPPWIQIRGGKGQSHWARDATTIWLAAEREDSSSDMQPFGWLLIEPSDASAPESLERWCQDAREQSKRPSSADARISRGESPTASGRAARSGNYLFRKGDRVTNGEEEATVVRDVRSTDARMEVEFEDDIEEVPVTGWRRV